MDTDSREVQPENVDSPMEATKLPIVAEVRDVQPLNA